MKVLAVAPVIGAALSAALLIALTVASSVATTHWKDSVAVFSQAVAVTHDNTVAERNLGAAFAAIGDQSGAIRHFRALAEAESEYRQALRLNIAPEFAARAHNDLGVILVKTGRFQQAGDEFRAALELAPGFEDARRNYLQLAGAER